METHNFIPAIAIKGAALIEAFKTSLSGLPGVVDVRGKGYMIGIQLDRPCGALVAMALEAGLLINVTRGDTIRLLPTFVMSEEQSEMLVTKLTQLVTEFLKD
jgi:acetylornithine aminotransferase